MMAPTESAVVSSSGLRLVAERFAGVGEEDGGRGESVPVLLLSAAEAPSTRWSAPFIDALADGIGDVIRFDTRDSGRSDSASAPYLLDDLAADAVAVLDHFGVDRAHLVGRSMGGMVAQVVALEYPERVTTMTIISSTAGPSVEHGPPAEWFVDLMTERLFGDPPMTVEERIAWVVDQQQWFAGTRYEFDRAGAEDWARAEVEQFWNDEVGHGSAVVESPSRYDRLHEIEAPVLVVHGTADPVYPVPHGQALAAGIPNAELRLVEELGHELPDQFAPDLASWIQDFVG